MPSENDLKHAINLSVRELVEHSLLSGDLDLLAFSRKYTQDPIRIHQWIQRQRPEEYLSEVYVSTKMEQEGFIIVVRGRIDGVYTYADRVIIDEIKTTFDDPEAAALNRVPVHWGQAKCYAYMYACEHCLSEISVQLTYYNPETRRRFEAREKYPFASLEEFFDKLVARYSSWARTLMDWKNTRNRSINELPFPFSGYRPGQQEIGKAVTSALNEGAQLLIQAPTGIGKTVSALYPAVKSVADQRMEKIFFLTARSTGRMSAEKAMTAMINRGLRLKILYLTAKEKICPFPGHLCTPGECTFARGHYDRIRAAVKEAFHKDSLSPDLISDFSQKHRVCPFELSLDLSLWADCVVCDYNYVFDPRVYLQRFFAEGKKRCVFIIDEAHNLVDRSREMYSADIEKEEFLEVRRVVKHLFPDIGYLLGRINSRMLKLRKGCQKRGGACYDQDLPQGLDSVLWEFISAARPWLSGKENRKNPLREKIVDLYSRVHHFLTIWDQHDSRYVTSYKSSDKNLMIKLYCIDPSSDVASALSRGFSALFLSATLVPVHYYIRILGCGSETRRLTLPSPFPRENLAVLIAPRISTIYRNREHTKSRVARMLIALARARPGNYLFYFPSYAYMNLIYRCVREIDASLATILQTPEQSYKERSRFLDRFRNDRDKSLAGFAVLGGVFSEGIDLAGDRLTGAAVVGVGLPALSPERDSIRDYFNSTENRGFEFSYMYPGLNKVLQAAGRVIRTENDRGAVLLIDERFREKAYRDLLPEQWQPHYIYSEQQLTYQLKNFWKHS